MGAVIPVERSDSKLVALIGRKICIVDRETGEWGFYDSPNRQITVLTIFYRYTVNGFCHVAIVVYIYLKVTVICSCNFLCIEDIPGIAAFQ